MRKLSIRSLIFCTTIFLMAFNVSALFGQIINTFPHTEDFESFGTCGTSCSTSCALSNGWTNLNIDDSDWLVDNGGTTSSGTGPSVDHNPGTSTGNYLYTEATGCSGATAAMTSPPIDLSTVPNCIMQFWYHMYGIDMGTLHVDISNNGGASYTDNVFGPITDNVDLWQLATVSLNDYLGDTIIVRFRGVVGIDYTSDMAIDDVNFVVLAGTDAGVSKIDSPISPISAGVQDVYVTLKNFGGDTLTSTDIGWSVNGMIQTPYAWSGSLLTFGESSPVNVGSFNFGVGNTTIKAWTANPNSTTDNDNSNDTAQVTVCTPLSGTYTIGGASPDFANFTEAVNTLINCGVNGPVVINVAPGSGPYNEQITITAIPGASSTNTITINGKGETLTFDSQSSDRHIIKLDGAKHITLDSLTLVSISTLYGWGIHLINNADSNTISNCTIDLSSGLASVSSAGFDGIVGTASTASATTGGITANYTTISGNTIIGGYYGIRLNGNGTSKIVGNEISGNTVKDFYSGGIYLDDNQDALVSNNDISRAGRSSVSTFYGVYQTGSIQVTVEKNRIHNTHDNASSLTGTTYGIYMYACDALPGQENKVINNVIYNLNSDGTIYAIYNSGSDGAFYYHNSISLDHTTSAGGTTRGFYQLTSASDIEFKNNVISLTRGGTGIKYLIYLGTNTSSVISDYNAYYTDTTVNLVGYFDGNDYNTLPGWQGALFDQHSVFADPGFVDATNGDLIPTNGALDAMGDTVGVVDDINGNPRDTLNPDLGAFEFVPPNLDASISWVSPVSPVNPGLQTITVNVANSISSNPNITSLSLTYTDGNSPVTELFSPINIAPGTDQDISFATPYNLVNSADLIAYINSVNGSSDAIQLNDTTALQNICTSLSGTYTIDAGTPTGGTNYNSFTDAVNALNNCGISGPVIFNVAPNSGPYVEQIEINYVNGASAVNTITFNGNGDTLKFDVNSVDRHLIRLNGAKHIIINDLNVKGLNDMYGWGIHLLNEADSNTINNCTIDVSAVTSTSSSNSVAIVASSSTSSTSSGANNGSYNLFKNNTIMGGYYCVRLNGSSTEKLFSNILENNIIQDFYSYGVYLDNNNGTQVIGNDINRANRTDVTTFRGLYLTAGNSNTLIERNRIHNTHDNAQSSLSDPIYGIFISSCDALTGEENKVVNNIIYNLNGIGDIYAFYNSSSNGVYYYHNTVALDDTSVSTTNDTRGFYQTTTADNIEFKNNIITIRRGGTGAKYCLYFASTSSNINSDNNVLYIDAPGANNQIGRFGTGDFATLSDWQTGANNGVYDLSSVSADPMYNDPVNGDFSPTNDEVNNTGTNVGITEDFNLNPRNVDFPDPGAYEFTPAGLDAAISWIAPLPPLTTGAHTVTVNINNTRTDTITHLVLTYTDGATPITESFSSLSLPTGNNQDLSFTSPYTLSGFTVMYAYIDSVNHQLDDLQLNDTTNKEAICASLSGNFTINDNAVPSPTNFTSFTDAINALMTCGINGPVVFDVAPGSGPYYEQITMPYVTGASSINTITFNGNGQVLAFNPNANDRHLIKLDGAKHVIINDLTILSTDLTYGYGVHFMDRADSNTINNCTIDLTNVTSTGSTNSTGIVFSASTTSPATTGDNGNYNSITNNTILGGYYGIRINGASSTRSMFNKIHNNTVADFYQYGIYLYYTEGTEIFDNDINRANRATVTTFYGIYMTTGNQGVSIERNRIHNTHDIASSRTGTTYGIYFTGSDAPMGHENRVINNALYNLNSDGTIYGIYNSSSNGALYYHNTISIDYQATSGGDSRGFYQTTTADSIQFINNLISMTRGGSGDRYCVYFSSTTSEIMSDYNVFYVDTNQVDHFTGRYSTDIKSFPAWQAVNGGVYDQNSFFSNPNLINAPLGNLAPINPLIDNKGTPLGIMLDLNSNPRDPVTPDIGAVEFTPATYDAATITLLEPTDGICGTSSIDVSAVISNYGVDTISNVIMTAYISGGLVDTLTGLSGAGLATFQEDTISLGTIDASSGGYLFFTIFTSLPGDANSFNDTIVTFRIINETPAAPVAYPYRDTICLNSSTTIEIIDTNYNYVWYDAPAGGNELYTGNLLTTDTTATYYVEATGEATYHVGPVDNTIGGGLQFSSFDVQGLYLEVYQPIVLDSVSVYAGSAGNVTLELSDPSNNTVINTATATVNSTARTTIPVGMTILPGSYRIDANGTTTSGLFRNDGGAMYPYEIPGIMAITGNTFDPYYYYYFYDWVVTATGCTGARATFSVFVDSSKTPVDPTYTHTVIGSGLGVSFSPNDTRLDNTYHWDFGDGTSSSIGSISHTYQNDGTYSACLTVENACSDGTSCDTFTICKTLSNSYTYQQSGTGLTVDFLFDGSGTPVTTMVDFGDGNMDTVLRHTYSTEGNYTVTFMTENLCGGKDTSDITVSICKFLNPGFTYVKSIDGFTFDFTGSIDGNPTSIAWDFGDGNADTVQNPSHTYATHGVYDVSLIVDNVCGDLDTITKSVSTCLATNVDFSYNVDAGGLSVTFTNNSTGSGLSYLWDFADGNTSAQTNPTHVYTTYGNYMVNLITTNACGERDTFGMTVPACTTVHTAGFNFSKQGDGALVNFSNTSTGSNQTFNWDFGDGNSSTTRDPSHTYTTNGNYTVTLIVTDICGRNDTSTQQVSIAVGIFAPTAFNLDVAIFPNPNEGQFTVGYTLNENSDVHIRIMNLAGKVIYQTQTTEKSGSHNLDLDLSEHAKGIYMLEIIVNEKIGISRFAIE